MMEVMMKNLLMSNISQQESGYVARIREICDERGNPFPDKPNRSL